MFTHLFHGEKKNGSHICCIEKNIDKIFYNYKRIFLQKITINKLIIE